MPLFDQVVAVVGGETKVKVHRSTSESSTGAADAPPPRLEIPPRAEIVCDGDGRPVGYALPDEGREAYVVPLEPGDYAWRDGVLTVPPPLVDAALPDVDMTQALPAQPAPAESHPLYGPS